MIIHNPHKKSSLSLLPWEKKSLSVLLVMLVFTGGVWLISEMPIFTEYKAEIFFKDNYPKIKVRYDEIGEDNWLPIMRRAVVDSAISNSKKYLSNDFIPHININIDFKSWESIKDERNAMMGKAFMSANKNKYKASIQYQGNTIPIKLRLKGERTDHINHPKRWSYRIKTRKGQSIFGMRRFSIQHPDTKGFQREAVFLQFAKELGILSLRYFFIRVSINGEDIGLMAVEEVPGKEELEYSGYKEGHLFKFDDGNVPLLYHSVASSRINSKHGEQGIFENSTSLSTMYEGHYSRIKRLYYNALNAPLRALTESKTPSMRSQEELAFSLMKSVMEGKIAPHKVFDAKKTGRYFAYLALWGNSHAASFRNARYYFSPYTLQFEPIVFDSNARSSRKVWLFPEKSSYRDHEFNRILLRDSVIMASYISEVRALEVMSRKPDFVDKLRGIERTHLDDLREEFLFLPEMDFSSLQKSIAEMSSQIDSGEFFEKEYEETNARDDSKPLVMPKGYVAPDVVHANIINENDKTYLEIHNLFPLKAHIVDLDIRFDGQPVALSKVLSRSLPVTIPPFYYHEYLMHTRIELSNLPDDTDVKVSGKVTVETQEHTEYQFDAGKSYAAVNTHPLEPMPGKLIVEKYPFIRFQEAENCFYIMPGIWIIDEKIIFPVGTCLHIKPQTKLLFAKNAGILLRGKIYAEGTAGQPVIFDSISGTLDDAWSGFTVMNAKERSLLKFVEIKNTNYTRYKGWELTGGVSFYKSDVDIEHGVFENSNAEDALNIVASEFTLHNSKIVGARSDGFDGDFVVGIISNSRFVNIGGDAIDFSGSEIAVEHSIFSDIHDKAVSVGEASTVSASEIRVSNSGTGVAVKDGSDAVINQSEFDGIRYATMMSYTKKNVYGPSRLVAMDIQYSESRNALVAQGKNSIHLDGKKVGGRKVNIVKLYEEGYMKK